MRDPQNLTIRDVMKALKLGYRRAEDLVAEVRRLGLSVESVP